MKMPSILALAPILGMAGESQSCWHSDPQSLPLSLILLCPCLLARETHATLPRRLTPQSLAPSPHMPT